MGALVLFLPPYSPDLNPIGEAFSKVKLTLQSFETNGISDKMNDIESILLLSFMSITQQDCINWINHCKIY